MDKIGPKTPPRLFIREWMEEKGIDQRRMADRLDCKEGTVSKLLTGKMQITQSWLAGFAYALGVEPSALYRDPATPSADDLLKRIPPEKRDMAIDYLRYLATGTDKNYFSDLEILP